MLESRVGCLSQRAGISELAQDLTALEHAHPFHFSSLLIQSNKGKEMRFWWLLAFLKFDLGTHRKLCINVIQTLPLFVYENPKLN